MTFSVKNLISLAFVSIILIGLYLLTVQRSSVREGTIRSGVVEFGAAEPASIIALSGDWLFEPALITRVQDATQTLHVPRVWDNREQGGFGSYAIRIQPHTINTSGYGLYFNRVGSAYRVYINGSLRLENGTVGTRRSDSVPQRATRIVIFNHDTLEPIDIVIQVSNFHHNKGGLKSTVYFGLQQQIVRHEFLFKILDILCVGGMIVISFFHLLLFVSRYSEREHLYISLFVLMLSFYVAGSGESVAASFLPGISYELLLRGLHLSLVLAILFYNRLYAHLFPCQNIRVLSWLVDGAAFSYVLFIIVAPLKLFTAYLIVVQGLAIVTTIYRNVGLLRALVQKNPNAVTVLFGNVAFSVAVLLEFIYVKQVTTNSRALPVGMLLLSISYNTLMILGRYLEKISHLLVAEKTVNEVRNKNKMVKAELSIRESQLTNLWESVTQPDFVTGMNKINARFEEIAYFKAERGVSLAFDNLGKEILNVNLSLATIVQMFDENRSFMRCHRLYAVKRNRIERIIQNDPDHHSLILTSGIRLPAGAQYLEELELLMTPA